MRPSFPLILALAALGCPSRDTQVAIQVSTDNCAGKRCDSLEQLIYDWAQAEFCGSSKACGYLGPDVPCSEYMHWGTPSIRPDWARVVAQKLDAGILTWDVEGTRTCIETQKNHCGFDCPLWQGTLAEGSACARGDCATGLYCDVSTSGCGVCKPKLGAGAETRHSDACPDWPASLRDGGYRCIDLPGEGSDCAAPADETYPIHYCRTGACMASNTGSPRCAPHLTEGMACVVGYDHPCTTPLTCAGPGATTCKRLPTSGESCAEGGPPCVYGYTCSARSGGTCVRNHGHRDDACSGAQLSCGPGLGCDADWMGTCQVLGQAGAPCSSARACADWTYVCVDGRCAAPSTVGQRCSQWLDCAWGLDCVSGACAERTQCQ